MKQTPEDRYAVNPEDFSIFILMVRRSISARNMIMCVRYIGLCLASQIEYSSDDEHETRRHVAI